MKSTGYSIGVGLTSACPFSCSHCYSGAGRNPVDLDPARLFSFMESFPVSAINLGTGESCMHPQFLPVVNGILDRGVPLALTTAGPSLSALPDSVLVRLHDVDLSLDYPVAALHDAVRAPGAFGMVLDGVRRCREIGVTVSLAMCLMRENAEYMEGMCRLARELGISLRVNVYKPVFSDDPKPSFELFWKAVSTLFRETDLVSCSEPVVNAALAYHGSPCSSSGSPCGIHGFRISPGGDVLPCVYWGPTGLSMERIIHEPGLLEACGMMCHGAALPAECSDCPWKGVCGGGCAGRRYYTGLSGPDEYCFHLKGVRPPELELASGNGEGFIHAGYLCTMIGRPIGS
jgi:radical SAM protein with 4Fe4S-binding SPASM domain